MAQRKRPFQLRRSGHPGSIALATERVGYQSGFSVRGPGFGVLWVKSAPTVGRLASLRLGVSKAALLFAERWPAELWTAALCITPLFTTSCLDAAPVYEQQQRIPPFLVIASVQPPVDEVVRLVANRLLRVYVPFRSEDLGEPLTAVFTLDGDFLGTEQLGPSVLEDTTRAVEFSFQPEVDPGCYLLSLMLTHRDNYSQRVSDESRAAYLYWWLSIEDERTGEPVPCPGEAE